MAPLSLSPGDANEYSCSAVMMTKPVSAPPSPAPHQLELAPSAFYGNEWVRQK